MKTVRFTHIALAVSLTLALGACSSSSKKASEVGPSKTTLASGNSSDSTAAQGSVKTVTPPKNACLLTNDQAKDLTGVALTGTSTDMGAGGTFCTYHGSDNGAGISISVKPYPDAASAHKLVDALLNAGKQMYSPLNKLDVGDGGGVGCNAGLCLARFTKGNVFGVFGL